MKATPSVNEAPAFLERRHSFYYSGKEQFVTVPVDVTSITVIATGAAGGKKVGGRGGRVFAKVPVVPGERLAVFVGGAAMGVNGGYNGGAPGGYFGDGQSYGGGGASDVREGGDRLRNRIVVAGAAEVPRTLSRARGNLKAGKAGKPRPATA
jgi:uncharacterized membrane protein YgcG